MQRLSGILGLGAVIAIACAGWSLGTSEARVMRRTYCENGRVHYEYPEDKDGNPHGVFRSWDPDGTLRNETEMVRGIRVAVRRFDESGKLVSEEREGSGYELVRVSR